MHMFGVVINACFAVEMTKTMDPESADVVVFPPFPFLRDVYKVQGTCTMVCISGYAEIISIDSAIIVTR